MTWFDSNTRKHTKYVFISFEINIQNLVNCFKPMKYNFIFQCFLSFVFIQLLVRLSVRQLVGLQALLLEDLSLAQQTVPWDPEPQVSSLEAH